MIFNQYVLYSKIPVIYLKFYHRFNHIVFVEEYVMMQLIMLTIGLPKCSHKSCPNPSTPVLQAGRQAVLTIEAVMPCSPCLHRVGPGLQKCSCDCNT